ncbi:MAG: tRNA-dihydrouridine synthase, partial [Planctomycetia bacterium]
MTPSATSETIIPPSPAKVHAWLGAVPLASPFTLAALSGYSDLGMRVTCRSLGACLTRNEVMLDRFVLEAWGGSRSGKLLDDGDRPVCVQLMGKDPDEMGRAAALMEEVGY